MSLPPMQIYQFDDELERATSAWLLKNGVNDPVKQRDWNIKLEDGTPLTLKVPRVETKVLFSGFGRKHYFVVPQTGVPWLDLADGITYLKVVTRRDDKESSHAYLRGLCRYLMQQVPSITPLLKYHKIEEMFETQSTVTFEADRLHDVSALSFQTTLRIRNEFFPTT